MMDLFRVLTPNNLPLSKEEVSTYLTGGVDPFMSKLDNSIDEFSDDLSASGIIKSPGECAIPQQYRQEELNTPGHCNSRLQFSHTVDCTTESHANQKGAESLDIYNWLRDNFEPLPNHSIARGDLYAVFCNFCEQKGITPCNQALFGKAVRGVFPCIRTRRIGIRNQSRYHYTGIRPKTSSQAGQLLSLIKKKSSVTLPNLRAALLSDYPRSLELGTQPHSMEQLGILLGGSLHDSHFPSDHLMTVLLPNFPTIQSTIVPLEIQDQTAMLLSLYRFLALDILKAVINTQFSKIQEIISVFWRNVPYDVYHSLTQAQVMALVLTCDRHIHAAMINLLAPDVLVNMPARMVDLLQQHFDQCYQQQIQKSLQACPPQLRCKKLQDSFKEVGSKNSLWRKGLRKHGHSADVSVCACHCADCDQVRLVLRSPDTVSELHSHLSDLDLATVIHRSRFASGDRNVDTPTTDRIRNGIKEFIHLLEVQASFDQYIKWIRSIFKLGVTACFKKGSNYPEAARTAVLEMSYITGIISRELKTGNTPPHVQGTYHLTAMFFVTYVRHLLEDELEEWTQDPVHSTLNKI